MGLTDCKNEMVYNEMLYSIDVALVGEDEAFKRWEVFHIGLGDYVTCRMPLHSFGLECVYRRKQDAPNLPSWDWHEAPEWAIQRGRNTSAWYSTALAHASADDRPPQAWFDVTADMSRGEYETLQVLAQGGSATHTGAASKVQCNSTKHNNPCIQKAGDDEPLFVLRAQDVSSPGLVRQWAFENSVNAPEKAKNAFLIADMMENWQTRKRADDNPSWVNCAADEEGLERTDEETAAAIDQVVLGGKHSDRHPITRLFNWVVEAFGDNKDDALGHTANEVEQGNAQPSVEPELLSGAPLHRAIAEAIASGFGPRAFQYANQTENWTCAGTWAQLVSADEFGGMVRRMPLIVGMAESENQAEPEPELVPGVKPKVDSDYFGVLVPFCMLMNDELEANRPLKGDCWDSAPLPELCNRIFRKTGRLQWAIQEGSLVHSKEYAADIANLCMMILDNMGVLVEEIDPPPIEKARSIIQLFVTKSLSTEDFQTFVKAFGTDAPKLTRDECVKLSQEFPLRHSDVFSAFCKDA